MPEQLKNMLGPAVVDDLAARFSAQSSHFDVEGFVGTVMADLESLELKQRISLIATALRGALAESYVEALEDVVAVSRSGVEGFAAWPLCTFVELFGIDHPDESLAAMEQLTQVMSCEFAIRPFLDRHLAQTIRQLEAWTSHPEPAVRRLVSEGTRPRLPWGPRVAALTDDPTLGLGLIERLRLDPSEDVRRSVANHLNDIAKDHPDLVVDTAARWLEEGVSRPMVAHALRTLVKQGHPRALRALGYTTDASVTVGFSVEPPVCNLGDSIHLEASIESKADHEQLLVVDFVIHHVTASGMTSPKVFKWKTVSLPAGDRVTLKKRRHIADASTRTYYEGRHAVDLQVAGTTMATGSFDLRRGEARAKPSTAGRTPRR